MWKAIALLALVGCLPAFAEEASTVAPAAASAPAPAAPTPAVSPALPPLIERFRLFPELALPPRPPLDLSPAEEGSKRLLHQTGDPDSLFTFGDATPEGELRLKAAIEVNEIILKALPPDLRVDPSDTRPRSAGSFSALDARGRPYQLRLGARLVW